MLSYAALGPHARGTLDPLYRVVLNAWGYRTIHGYSVVIVRSGPIG